MNEKQEFDSSAVIMANTDAISAVIACLANSGNLHPHLFKTALAAIKEKGENRETSLKNHPLYDGTMKLFVAAAEKKL